MKSSSRRGRALPRPEGALPAEANVMRRICVQVVAAFLLQNVRVTLRGGFI